MADRKTRLAKLQEMALTRLQDNKKRNDLYIALEKMEANVWSPPESLDKLDWIIPTQSSDPQDAMRAAEQVHSGVSPRIQYIPTLGGELNQNVASVIERNLAWQWDLLEERSRLGVLNNLVRSAFLYSTVAAQVKFLPHQIEALKQFKGRDTESEQARLKMAMRSGKFSVSMRNPKDVYARHSDDMLEDVMFIRLWDSMRFLNYFGGSVPKKLASEIMDDKHKYMVVYEHIDYSKHTIWATPQDHDKVAIETVQNIRPNYLMEADNQLGFIPWSVRSRGTSLTDMPEAQLRPLLYGVHSSGHWDTQNMLLTLAASEAVVHAAQARRRVKGPNPDSGFQVDHNEPGGIEKVDPIHEVESLPPDPIDEGLLRISDLLGGMIGKETVAKLIQNPEVSADVPFSSMNLIFQLGANSLEPFKKLAERSLVDIFKTMLYFVDEFVTEEEPLVAHSTTGDVGEQLLLHKGMFDVDNLHLKVNLTADVPSDIMQKTNWAVAQNQNLQVPLSELHEKLNYQDSDGLREKWMEEQLDSHFIQLSTQADQIQQQLAATQAQMEMQQQQIAQQQQQLQGGGGQAPPSGQDPSAGGSPPIQGGAPTREQASGQTRGGQGVA